jgi:putative ABC transport system permease protein
LIAAIVAEGALMAGLGVAAGAIGGYALARLAGSYFSDIRMPSTIPVISSALVLLASAMIASLLPAMRAARVDVMQELRSE